MALAETMLAFLDTETTGLEHGKDQVVEVAVILTQFDLTEIARYDKKIKPTIPVDPIAAGINGYNKEEWDRDGVEFSDFDLFLRKHIPFGSIAIPVGHNIGFDMGILRGWHFKNKFCPFSYHQVDTVSLVTVLKTKGKLNTPNLKLVTVAKALNLKNQPTHRAMADSLASMELYVRFEEFLRA